MEIALFIFISVLIIVAFIAWDNKKRCQKLEKVFAGRPSLSKEDFYQKYFGKLGIDREVVDGVRDILQEELDADLSRLSAEDDFSENLSFFWNYDSMADVAIVVALEKRFGILIEDREAANAKSIRDIVNLVHLKRTRAPRAT